MDDKELLDICTDYLISSFGLTTGTGLSRLLNGAITVLHPTLSGWAEPQRQGSVADGEALCVPDASWRW